MIRCRKSPNCLAIMGSVPHRYAMSVAEWWAISEGDLMLPFGAENAMKRTWWLTLLAEGINLGPQFVDYIRVDDRRARDLMVTRVITAREAASVREIADLLARHRIIRAAVITPQAASAPNVATATIPVRPLDTET
jgi:hypothetical protein